MSCPMTLNTHARGSTGTDRLFAVTRTPQCEGAWKPMRGKVPVVVELMSAKLLMRTEGTSTFVQTENCFHFYTT